MRKGRGWLAALSLPLFLSGCLLTVGGPLARRVEPKSWRLEAAVGPSLFNEFGSLNALAYGYAGHALGRHWEIGALPYLYAAGGQAALVLAVPVRWDPFPYSWPVHLVPFAGPLSFWMPGTMAQVGGMAGAGFSLSLGELVELYASSSVFLPVSAFATSSVGARFDLANGFELGLGAVIVNRTGDTNGDSGRFVLASVTLSTLLGPK
jgi:hypothetical protein